jgi:hypothetical protein
MWITYFLLYQILTNSVHSKAGVAVDTTNNLQFKLVNKNTTLLSAEFVRALNTGDGKDRAITSGPLYVIWSGNYNTPIGKLMQSITNV